MRALLLGSAVLIGAAVGGTIYLSEKGDAPVVIAAANSPSSTMGQSDNPPAGTDDPDLRISKDNDAGTVSKQAPVTAETAATEAAVAAVRSTANMVTDGYFTRRDLISDITTQRFGPELIELTSLTLSNFSFEIDTSEQFWLIVEPVRSKAETVESGRVRVEMWALVIVASTESGVGRESWQTITLEMQLVEGRWLVDSWLTDRGPAPAPSTDLVFASPVELGEMMSWPVAPATVSDRVSSDG